MKFKISEASTHELQTGFPITQAVIDGFQSGRVYNFKDNYFIVHKSGFCSLIQKSPCLEELIMLFREDEIPRYIHIYDIGEILISKITMEDDLFGLKIRHRVKLIYSNRQMIDVPSIDGFTLNMITDANFDFISALDFGIKDRFWDNKSDFIKYANGVVIINSIGEPVCICYAAAIANDVAEIDILTKGDYRNRGLAKFAVAGFVNNCIKKNIIPNWDCFEENEASLRTAKGLLFKEINRYRFLSLYKKKAYES